MRDVYRETRTKESVIPVFKEPYIVFKVSEREHLDAVAFQTLGYANFKFIMHYQKYPQLLTKNGDRSSTVVKVLCYKSEGRWFDPSWCHWNIPLT